MENVRIKIIIFFINIKATRGRNLLDPIFTNAPDCYKCTNHQVLGSDHETVIATPLANIYKQQQAKQQKIVTRGGKIADTIEQIGNIEWDDLINLNVPPQSKFDAFYDTLNAIQDTCHPLKTVKIKNDQPWMTTHIKNLITERQKLFHNTKNDDNKKWKKMANIIRHQIRKRKKSYYNRFKNRDSKIWWKTVNELNGETTNKEEIKLSAEELNIGFH
jgi:hypothetical protein